MRVKGNQTNITELYMHVYCMHIQFSNMCVVALVVCARACVRSCMCVYVRAYVRQSLFYMQY